jgi:hypothetical protein
MEITFEVEWQLLSDFRKFMKLSMELLLLLLLLLLLIDPQPVVWLWSLFQFLNLYRDPSRWPRGTLYPQKLVLTSLISGGRSVGIVRWRTKATELLLLLVIIHSDSLEGGSARRKASICTHDNTNTEYTHTNTHVSSGIQTHNLCVLAGEYS